MINKESADNFVRNLNGLGYVKINVGQWDERIADSGQGFPTTTYICPFCKEEYNSATNYCPNCGAKMDAERKDKFVPLRNEDIHFNSKEDEKAFYEALAERKEE